MIAIALALLSASAYGVSDFLAGLAARRSSFVGVALVAQLCAAAVMVVAAPLGGGHLSAHGVAWGAGAGLGAGAGSVSLYRGLGSGQMSVVGPLSGVGAAAIPVIVGLLLGEHPSAITLAGIVLALPAVWLIARSGPSGEGVRSDGVAEGILAGVGFGVFFLGLARSGADSGLWPSASAGVTASLLVGGFALLHWAHRSPLAVGALQEATTGVPMAAGSALSATSVIAGGLAAGASVLYLIAVRRGLLVVVAVLASLYPAVTVLAARVVLHERSSRAQLAGLGLAAVAVVAITAG